MNHNRIKNDFQNLPLPPHNPEKIKQTINLAQTEIRHTYHQKGLSFLGFLRVQIRFISSKMWLSQLALLSLFIWLIVTTPIVSTENNELFRLLSTIAPMIVLCGFSELVKSQNCDMAEIESVTRFSLLRLTIARAIIIAVADLFCLTIIILATSVSSGLAITSFILYLLVPFLLTLCACLAVTNRMQSRHDGAICASVSVLCSVMFCLLSSRAIIYTATSVSAWVIILIATCFYGAYEFKNTINRLKGELIWNR